MDKNQEYSQIGMSQNEVMKMMDETSRLAAQKCSDQLSSAASAIPSNTLANEVEFWKWMGRNFSKSGIFNTAESAQQYLAQLPEESVEGIRRVIQGKGYEWDWMSAKRSKPWNLLKRFEAGDVANRPATDVTEHNILTGSTKDYQMKAYAGKANPRLKNTPKDVTVVTGAEKTDAVRAKGFENVEEFQNSKTIKRTADKRTKQIIDGKACPSYHVGNVAGAMAKAGLMGCVIGIGTQAAVLYRSWKQKRLSDEEYLKEVLAAGGDAGVTAALTSGLMIPVSAFVTAAGLTTCVTFPAAFVFGAAVSKVVSPCFGRGEYREILSDAKYYQNLQLGYIDMLEAMEYASGQYCDFIMRVQQQERNHQVFQQINAKMNQSLNDLYNSI